MSKVLTEFEILRYAIILEVFMEKKFGTYPKLFVAFKDKKEEKPVLMVMYESMMYEERLGLESLDDWYYAHPEIHEQVNDYSRLVAAQKESVELLKEFPLIFSCKFLQNHLPSTHPIVKKVEMTYARLQRLSDRIRFPKGTKISRQFDSVLAKDGFYSWDAYLTYELERIGSTAD
ncbi:hypothetical protein pEaSNUABM34_00218 [Erwinia phage pEa_SNUABM_34]|nr:hypothetical protein pEaSNUABM34_00218 [Erwinia phage pEa_SNUABM_34]